MAQDSKKPGDDVQDGAARCRGCITLRLGPVVELRDLALLVRMPLPRLFSEPLQRAQDRSVWSGSCSLVLATERVVLVSPQREVAKVTIFALPQSASGTWSNIFRNPQSQTCGCPPLRVQEYYVCRGSVHCRPRCTGAGSAGTQHDGLLTVPDATSLPASPQLQTNPAKAVW